MTRNSGPLPNGRGSHRMVVFAALFAMGLLAAIIAAAVWAPWRQAAGSLAVRAHREELAAAREYRAAALREIWRTLEQFRAVHGAWPTDLPSLRAFAPIVDDALDPPPLSERGAYTIDFAALNAPPAAGPTRIIVDDPGIRAPGAAGDPSALEPFRVVLLSTGEVVGLQDANRRGVRWP